MERFIRLVIVVVGAVLGWQGGGYLLSRLLSHFVLLHMAHGNGFGEIFMFGFNLGELVGISMTVGLFGGLWGGWTLARRYKPTPRPPLTVGPIITV